MKEFLRVIFFWSNCVVRTRVDRAESRVANWAGGVRQEATDWKGNTGQEAKGRAADRAWEGGQSGTHGGCSAN